MKKKYLVLRRKAGERMVIGVFSSRRRARQAISSDARTQAGDRCSEAFVESEGDMVHLHLPDGGDCDYIVSAAIEDSLSGFLLNNKIKV